MLDSIKELVHIELPTMTVILKNGKELDFYINIDIRELSRLIDDAAKCIYIEDTIIMKDEILYIKIS